jgi:membrane protein implicated in regulation of membrane protease activity
MCGHRTAEPVAWRTVADRDRFFRFNGAFLLGFICFAASAWLSEGPSFVAVVLVAAVAIGGYYAVWRWLRPAGQRDVFRGHAAVRRRAQSV